MKLAIVLPAKYKFCVASPNSIETVVRVFASQLSLSDQLVVICEPGAEKRCTIPVIEVDSHQGLGKRNRHIIDALRKFNPDYIEFHQAATELRPIAKAFSPNKATVFYRHNYFKKPKGLFSTWRFYSRMKYFRSVIMVSEALREDFIRQFPRYSGLTYAIPNAINAAEWPGDAADKDQVVMFSGRAAPEKGVAPLAEALVSVLPRFPAWRAVLILSDFAKHEDWATKILEPLASSKQVTILKNQKLDVVKAHIRRSAIAVIPSIWKEPFGLTALEAHAGGCAVISSGTGGLREVSGDHAILLDEVTGPAISAALTTLIEHKDKRMDLARSGQSYALATHSTEARAMQLAQVRREIVSKVNRR